MIRYKNAVHRAQAGMICLARVSLALPCGCSRSIHQVPEPLKKRFAVANAVLQPGPDENHAASSPLRTDLRLQDASPHPEQAHKSEEAAHMRESESGCSRAEIASALRFRGAGKEWGPGEERVGEGGRSAVSRMVDDDSELQGPLEQDPLGKHNHFSFTPVT